MKKIKLKLGYQSFPIWLYDENDNFIENELPNELIGDDDIDPLCVHFQEQIDLLYKNDEYEFKYIGFENLLAKEAFEEKLIQIIKKLDKKVGKKYEILNNIDIDNL
jgi:hypothetical protein